MSRPYFIISIFLVLASVAAVSAEDQKMKVKGPITITSASLTADNKAHTALFEGNVAAKTAEMTIYADRMLVSYKEGGGDVTKIEATGNVRLVKGTRLITAQTATYYADEDKIVFTGEPRAMDGENVITGTVMTYFIADDRSLVEKSRVFLKNKRDK